MYDVSTSACKAMPCPALPLTSSNVDIDQHRVRIYILQICFNLEIVPCEVV